MTPLLLVCGAWLAGVAAGNVLGLQGLAVPFVVAAGAATALGVVGLRRPLARRSFLAAVLVTLALAGAWRTELHATGLTPGRLAGVTGPASLRGVVAGEPERSDASLRWPLRVQEALLPGEAAWQPATDTVLVWSRHAPALQYGDRVELIGRLEPPPTFDDFDYAAYLARQGVHAVVRYPATITVEGGGWGDAWQAAALGASRALSAALDRLLPEPQNALAQGILLGVRSGMPRDLVEDFRATGTTHILAISGHNMAVVAGLLSLLAVGSVGRRSWRFVVPAVAALGAYAVLVGLPPSVVRAAIMASLALVAGALGRESYPVGGLALAAALMTAANPYLLQDAGFQLSFAAMAGVLGLGPPLARGLGRLWPAPTGQGWFAHARGLTLEGAGATLGATALTLPIQAITFGQVTALALPTTLFALPFMGVLLPAAGVAALVGALPQPLDALALPAAAVAWAAAWGMAGVVQLWAQAPLASLTVPAGNLLWLAAYVPAAAALWWACRQPAAAGGAARLPSPAFRWQPGWAPRAALAAGLAAAGLVWWQALADPQEVTLHFLDTGGDVTLIEGPGGQRILVNGGPSGPALARQLSTVLPPWDRRIDVVVLANPGRQHVAGLVEALRRYEVGLVAESGLPGPGPEYAEWQRTVAAAGVRQVTLRAGAQMRLQGATVRVLHPSAPWLERVETNVDRADASLVLEVEAHGHRVLLTSDLRARGALALAERGALSDVSVLKVPASAAGANMAALLPAVRPAAVVASGSEPEFGWVAGALAAAGETAPVLRSDRDGTVRLVLGPGGAVLRGSRPGHD